MKSAFTVEQTRVLAAIVQRFNGKVVVVGAAALGCHVPMTWRSTYDVDIAILTDVMRASAELHALGLIRDPKREHSWRSPNGVILDVLPTTEADLARGSLVWTNGNVMNIEGFELAFAHTQSLPLTATISIEVARMSVIAILKMIAWLDAGYDRSRDLDDLGYLLSEYLDDDDDRHWQDGRLAEIQFDQHSAAALAHDVAAIATAGARRRVDEFVARAAEPNSWAFARLAAIGRSHGLDRSSAFETRMATFRREFNALR